ncbi:MAG: NrfD/PsrC family molybdoenzyme membrane anchor subunit [Chloroflexota bacterium]|jgi:formate-dependent nitrite reductase membrane component NrfD|nr:polysulfide reductase NrfD [Chloroflexota bacterium]
MNNIHLPYWEGWIVTYFFIGGLAGGAYFIACLLDLMHYGSGRAITRVGWAIAFPAALVCAVCLILDLGMPERFINMVINVKAMLPTPKIHSPISVGSYIILVFSGLSFVHFLRLMVDKDMFKGGIAKLVQTLTTGTWGRIISALGALFGLLLAGYTATLLATTHFAAWKDSPLIGTLFVASGVSTGLAAIGLILAMRNEKMSNDVWSSLKRADNFAIIVEIVALVLMLITLGGSAAPYLKPFTATLLIGGTLLCGLLIPLILQWKPAFAGAHASASITIGAALLILLGGLILRLVIVLAPQGFI